MRGRFETEPAFIAVNLEADRLRIFTELMTQIDEACLHDHEHKRIKKSKKHSRHRSHSRSVSPTIYLYYLEKVIDLID